MNKQLMMIAIICGLSASGLQAKKAHSFPFLNKAIAKRSRRTAQINLETLQIDAATAAVNNQTQATTENQPDIYIIAARAIRDMMKNKLINLEETLDNNKQSFEALTSLDNDIHEEEIKIIGFCDQPELPAEALALYQEAIHYIIRMRLHVIEQVAVIQPVPELMQQYVVRTLQNIAALRNNQEVSIEVLKTEQLARRVADLLEVVALLSR